MENLGGFGGDQGGGSSSGGGNRAYHRHTASNIQRMEAFFRECPHPNGNQCRELGRELGLEPNQIKFWFQNKRNQTKNQKERADNEFLRAENERMRSENVTIKEAVKKLICASCDGSGSPNVREDRSLILENLKVENAKLKEEYDKVVAAFLTRQSRNPLSEGDSVALSRSSMNMPHGGSLMINETANYVIDPDHVSGNQADMRMAPQLLVGDIETEKPNMIDTSKSAMSELVKLIQVNEPLWIKSPVTQKYMIDYENYNVLFPKANRFLSAHLESSKEFAYVPMSVAQLVNMFLNAEKYEALFFTIISQARTIYIIDNGRPENRDGCMQLMYQKLHFLSPMVKPRESYFIRFSRELERGVWIVGDVSYNVSSGSTSPFVTWRRPSGCMIQEAHTGFSKVTWVDHVEVDNGRTHSLYRNLVCNALAFGAVRWISTLQRMCERINAEEKNNTIANEIGACRDIMQLSHKMIREFSAMLCSSRSSNSMPLPGTNEGRVDINYICMNTGDDQQGVGAINVVASFWLPIPPDNIFSVLMDKNARFQWDVLSRDNLIRHVAHISTGNDPRNCISISQSQPITKSNVIVLQESFVDPLGSTIVYAPIEYSVLQAATRGDPLTHALNPSGFVISPDGCPHSITGASTSRGTTEPSGSLVTLGFQILDACPSPRQLDVESMGAISTIIDNTMRKLKVALNCPI